MEKSLSIRIEAELLAKLHYVAKYEDRSANGEILQLIRKRVREFEKEHGEIITCGPSTSNRGCQ